MRHAARGVNRTRAKWPYGLAFASEAERKITAVHASRRLFEAQPLTPKSFSFVAAQRWPDALGASWRGRLARSGAGTMWDDAGTMWDDRVPMLGHAITPYFDDLVDATVATRLAAELAMNRHATDIDLCGHAVGDVGAMALATALRSNVTLTTMDLSNNQIGARGARALVAALQHNSTLVGLDLSDNEFYDIESELLIAVADKLDENALLAAEELRKEKTSSALASASASAAAASSSSSAAAAGASGARATDDEPPFGNDGFVPELEAEGPLTQGDGLMAAKRRVGRGLVSAGGTPFLSSPPSRPSCSVPPLLQLSQPSQHRLQGSASSPAPPPRPTPPPPQPPSPPPASPVLPTPPTPTTPTTTPPPPTTTKGGEAGASTAQHGAALKEAKAKLADANRREASLGRQLESAQQELAAARAKLSATADAEGTTGKRLGETKAKLDGALKREAKLGAELRGQQQQLDAAGKAGEKEREAAAAAEKRVADAKAKAAEAKERESKTAEELKASAAEPHARCPDPAAAGARGVRAAAEDTALTPLRALRVRATQASNEQLEKARETMRKERETSAAMRWAAEPRTAHRSQRIRCTVHHSQAAALRAWCGAQVQAGGRGRGQARGGDLSRAHDDGRDRVAQGAARACDGMKGGGAAHPRAPLRVRTDPSASRALSAPLVTAAHRAAVHAGDGRDGARGGGGRDGPPEGR